MRVLHRLTTDYVEEEDRIRVSGASANGDTGKIGDGPRFSAIRCPVKTVVCPPFLLSGVAGATFNALAEANFGF